MAATLPDVFDAKEYLACWSDLAGKTPEELQEHYEAFGINEGRRANGVITRKDFAALVPSDSDALEIGPFCSPLLRGPRARFFDVLTTAELRDRGRQLGTDPDNAPDIDFVSPVGDLSIVDQTFDNVISSHCIEHQPDLVAHLQQVARILQPGGRYFLLVPDKRFCFDALIPESSVAEVLDAHVEGRTVHRLQSVIEHRALTTHNDCKAHWRGEHGGFPAAQVARTAQAVQEFTAAAGGYVDVHAWQFTPSSMTDLIQVLHELGHVPFALERMYPTRMDDLEFWMVLRKP